jgi:Uma2 family endonuclease
MYAQHNIPEYWVINVADSQIHVFYDSDGSDFRSSHIIQPPAPLAPRFKPSATLNTEQLFEVR